MSKAVPAGGPLNGRSAGGILLGLPGVVLIVLLVTTDPGANILVRFVVDDDKKQADRAQAVLGAGPVRLPPTVLLGLEGVLRSTYRLPRAGARELARGGDRGR